MKPAIILLTFNSEATLPQTLAAVNGLAGQLFVVDSGSSDQTLQIAARHGAHVVHHPFSSYGAQRNWAIDHLPITAAWQLHLDADEALTPALRDEIAALPEDVAEDGFLLGRNVRFLGRELRHGGMNPTWHMRLFRTGRGRCEEREYDQHFICSGPVKNLRGLMIDDNRMPLTEWTARHNRWADAEVRESLRQHTVDDARVKPRLFGSRLETIRWLRARYVAAPLFLRPFLLWFYRYVLALGFLDGKEGFIFYTLQTFWFRFLIDSKMYEARLAKARARGLEATAQAGTATHPDR